MLLALLFTVALSAGCSSSGGSASGSASPSCAHNAAVEQEKKVVKAAYEKVRDTIVVGDMDALYQLYSERKKKQQPLNILKEDFARDGALWQKRFAKSETKQVAIEGNEATVLVRMSDGKLEPVWFVKENGQWKVGPEE